MRGSLELLLGVLDREDRPSLAGEDLDGMQGPAVRVWQAMGFLGSEPTAHPIPGCPHCGEGVPYRVGNRHLCNRCHEVIDHRHLLVWPLHLDAFLRWLAASLRLRGTVRLIDRRLWQMGTWESAGTPFECFYRRPDSLSEIEQGRLAAYRNALLLYGITPPPEEATLRFPSLSLLELLRGDVRLTVIPLEKVLRKGGTMRFMRESGALWAGDIWLGEVPVGSREFFFLDCLAADIDQFVPYADIKDFVQQHTGSKDSTEEATFCHRIKNRIKKNRWIAHIDRVLATTNKGSGYRLRGRVEALDDRGKRLA